MKLLTFLLLFTALIVVPVARLSAEDTNAAAVWKLVEAGLKPPTPPDAWKQHHPTQAEIEQFQQQNAAYAAKAAAQMRDFAAKYPNTPEAAKALRKEYDFLGRSLNMRDTNQIANLIAVGNQVAKLPDSSEDERYEIRSMAVQLAAMLHHGQSTEAVMRSMEQQVRQLMKEFPKRKDPWPMLLEIAGEYDGDQARGLYKEIAASPDAPAEVKTMAEGQLKKLDMLGKPFALKFKAVDGREVDTASLKGKVVLIDFWATWCGPCVAELPHLLKTYESLHPKGLEIVGISLDQDKAKLEKFVTAQKMTWPQYFDGQGWKNKYAQEYSIVSIPTMWLVDKQGNLRDLNARGDLDKAITKLLEEK